MIAFLLGYPLLTRKDRTIRLARPSLKQIAIEALIAAVVFIPVLLINAAVLIGAQYLAPGSRTGGENVQQFARSSLSWVSYVYLFTAMLIGPVSEEVFHRGFLYNAFRKRVHVSIAVVLQAAIFSLSHPYPIVGLIDIFIFGLMLAAVYHWRKTVLTPTFLHIYFNVLIFAMALMAASNFGEAAVMGVTPDVENERCVVKTVIENGPAWNSGIRAGDIIIGTSEFTIRHSDDLYNAMRSYKAGETIRVWYERDGEENSVEVHLVSRNQVPRGSPEE